MPTRPNFVTPYGTLGIKSYGYVFESRLQINNEEVSPTIQGLLTITYAFSLPKAEVALVSVNEGSEQCPYAYRWVVLHAKGYTVSPPISACSDRIRVTVNSQSFTLEAPNPRAPDKIDTYIYDGRSKSVITRSSFVKPTRK